MMSSISHSADLERSRSTQSATSPINYSLSSDGSYVPKLPTDPLEGSLLSHPDIINPGLEPVYGHDEGKEVIPEEPAPYYSDQKIMVKDDPADIKPVRRRRRRICGLPIWLFWLLLAVVVLAIGLGVGLGVGLANSNESASGGVRHHYSKSGAFNGTGIALASYSFGSGGYGLYNVYFQHWTGQLRKMQLGQDGTWSGGDASNVVAVDAKNGTPISAAAYTMNGKSSWHIFYIDKNNIIRERVSDNATNQWQDGPLGDLNLKAMNSDAVGLQACWYGNFYGDSTYTHSPIPGTGSNTTSPDSVIGIHLWYGSNPTTIPEYSWTYNTSKWVYQQNFTANGHAGIGCYTWGPGSNTYVMMVDLDDDLQVAWKELNATIQATANHPVNQWTNTSISIPKVYPNTSLGYTNYLYAQLDDYSIAGYNVSFDAQNTAVVQSQDFEIPQKALPGSHFSVISLPNASGGYSIAIFDQTNGSDITINMRDLNGGPWSYTTLPIPK